MEQQISFSDFLKEGALLQEHTTRIEEKEEIVKKPVRIEAFEPANKENTRQFWKKLRHFYRTGEIENEAPKNLLPALPAPYLMGADWITDYPFYTDEVHAAKTLHELLKSTINENFDPKKDRILFDNIPRLVKLFRKNMDCRHDAYDFVSIAERAFADFAELEVHGSAKEQFLSGVEKLKNLLPHTGTLLSFSAHTPIHILSIGLNRNFKNRESFVAKCTNAAIALEEKLAVEKAKSNQIETNEEDFSNDLVSFDKIAELQPDKGAELMAADRVARIKEVIAILHGSKDVLLKTRGYLAMSESIKNRLYTIGELKNTQQSVVDDAELYSTTLTLFNQVINEITPVFKALRIANLELADKYVDDLHNDFFEHFNWHRLSGSDWQYFPPVVLLGNTRNFMEGELSELSKLLSSNKPIRVLAINEKTFSTAMPNVSWEDASHTFKQELASIAISHRSTHTYQGSLDQPLNLMQGMLKAFEAQAPSMINILVHQDEITRKDFIQITSAVESRYAPVIEYDMSGGKWGSRFNISNNPQPEKNWPSYPFKYVNENELETSIELPFTYADYKALDAVKVNELMHVPEQFVSDSLVPISEFLTLNEEQLTGKVPFIWMVDADNLIHKMAMPYMWVVSCQERLDFWNYVQELSGINSYHVELALQKAKEAWNEAKALELADLKSFYEKEINKIKGEAANKAMENLADVLLGLNTGSFTPSAAPAKSNGQAQEKVEESPKAEAAKPAAKPAVKEVKKEAWLESFKCTSCNDCTEHFPDIFAYNEDKQAFIKDASKGSFADLVEAAEACPAACIHPGAPLNPNEPDLQEYLERAKKFN